MHTPRVLSPQNRRRRSELRDLLLSHPMGFEKETRIEGGHEQYEIEIFPVCLSADGEPPQHGSVLKGRSSPLRLTFINVLMNAC